MLVESLTVVGIVYFIYEGFVSIQACKLLKNREKLLDQDMKWMESNNFSWGEFNSHFDRQYEEYPELFLVPYIPPTLFWVDERTKYLESKSWVCYPQNEVRIKIKAKKERVV